MSRVIILVVIVVLVLLVIWYLTRPPADLTEPDATSMLRAATTAPPYAAMTDRERIDFVIRHYFGGGDAVEASEARVKAENKFLDNLPIDNSCPDRYNRCAEWAANDECRINPEWMLDNCPRSCASCKMTDEEKQKTIAIFNSRDPPHCVYHGESYPGPFTALNTMTDYR